MRRTAALALALCLLLCSACGGAEVDITKAPEPTAAPMPTPGPSPTPEPTPTPEPGEMVRVVDIIPDIRLDIRYTAAENFTGEVIYESAEAYLRRGTAEKLSKVQDELEELGYSLTIWDAWRPVAAQFALWRACPDARYVADPFNGFSGHCRGNTVDITITTLDGEPVELPSGFDDFSALADRDYSDVSETAAANARLLKDAMTARASAATPPSGGTTRTPTPTTSWRPSSPCPWPRPTARSSSPSARPPTSPPRPSPPPPPGRSSTSSMRWASSRSSGTASNTVTP